MARRKSTHQTGLPRISGIGAIVHHAWIAFVCLKCKSPNFIDIGEILLDPWDAYLSAHWECKTCNYVHSKDSVLPFNEWPKEYITPKSIKCQRFWQGFFRLSTENKESYWKICNACGRILPGNSFSRHKSWGPLEKQMECRSCKGAINAYLNPKRTTQQLHESSIKRRIGDMLLEGEDEAVNIKGLFRRFNNRCFKTGNPLDIRKRDTWAIDHILPSSLLYPLSVKNAALLSKEANTNKRNKWPSHFYNNNELIALAQITGADLSLLSRKVPIINPEIDVNTCVSRFLRVRQHSDLSKRIMELKKLLEEYSLIDKLSKSNRNILGY